ncbi:MAG TPA: type II toxin-antitoxin system RelE/ParE family toxin [Armatimonadota bacterium]|jgi:proteic killer suppression protein
MTEELAVLFRTGQGMHLHPNVVKAFIKAVRIIDAAQDERDLRAAKGRRMEKLSGNREGQYSIRLNDQYRLIFTMVRDDEGHYVFIIEMIDYH